MIAYVFFSLLGSPYTGCSYDFYQMPVIDLMYVRKTMRRKGLATMIVSDVVQMFPKENIGLSEPVSDNMLKGESCGKIFHLVLLDLCCLFISQFELFCYQIACYPVTGRAMSDTHRRAKGTSGIKFKDFN